VGCTQEKTSWLRLSTDAALAFVDRNQRLDFRVE
jgi:hypothetical protein